MSDTSGASFDAQEGTERPLERIRAVMARHQPKQVADRTSRPGYVLWSDGCSACDWIGQYTGTDYESFAHHVAAAVVESLGLTPEWTWSWPNGSGQGIPGRGFSVPSRAQAVEEGGEYTIVRRFVTAWEQA